MTDADFNAVCELAFETLRDLAPYDTGNLSRNAIKLEFTDAKHARIYVSEEIAPYMPYTNEPWLAERLNGKKNPNEGWFDAAAELIAELVADLAGGSITHVDA